MKLFSRLRSAITSTCRPRSSTYALSLRFLDDPSRSNSLSRIRQRSTICDHLLRITELFDTRFEKLQDQYQLCQRASIVLNNWKDAMREYLGRPGWSMRKQDGPLRHEYSVFYSTAGRDYHTFPPYQIDD